MWGKKTYQLFRNVTVWVHLDCVKITLPCESTRLSSSFPQQQSLFKKKGSGQSPYIGWGKDPTDAINIFLI